MSIRRALLNKISNLDRSILLIGPRQTGKSTLIQEMPVDLKINFADEQQFVEFLRDPSLLKKIIKNNRRVFIDEIQRIPSILNTVQSLVDHDKKLQFYLTGSSARKLKRGQANLLPGRLLTYELGPLTHQELGELFDVSKALRIGLLPGIYTEEAEDIAQKTLKSYATTYLKEEVQAEALTRNLEGFSRFFQIVASRSGNFIDFAKVSNQAMIERTTSKRYFDILVDTLIVYPVDAFAKSGKRRLVQHPRYYFFDVGVLNGCLENFNLSHERMGCLFEHLFLQLVLATAKSHDESIRVSVYRTEAGAEVDFIIEKNNELFAVEVKASRNIGSSDLRGLKSFSEFYGKKHQSFIVYLGERDQEMEGINIGSISSVLKKIFAY